MLQVKTTYSKIHMLESTLRKYKADLNFERKGVAAKLRNTCSLTELVWLNC